jgi:YT521-B-like domain
MSRQSQPAATLLLSEVFENKARPVSDKDQIAALKMRAKESVAKRAQSIRSASNESRIGEPDLLEEDFLQSGGDENAVQFDEPESKSYLSIARVKPSSASFEPLAVIHNVPAKATSVELDDLLAEGRAAASLAKTENVQASPAPGQRSKLGDVQEYSECEKSETGEIQDDSLYRQQEPRTNGQSSAKVENFPAAEIEDIGAWLAMTGYYDKPYRNKVLSRRKRLEEIEEEKLRLLEEEQEDQRNRSQFHGTTPFAAMEMPKPSASIARPRAPIANHDLGLRIKNSASKKMNKQEDSIVADDVTFKRRMDEDVTDNETLRQSKAARIESYRHSPPLSKRTSLEKQRINTVSPENNKNRVTVPPHRQSPPDRNGNHHRVADKDEDGSGPMDRSAEQVEQRNEKRGRSDLHHDSSLSMSNPQTSDSRTGKVRFFLLKSWNYENIAIAQEESTWATQTKNEDIFVEAFKTCRDVVFFFSANHSKAFQGYARMQGLPGERGVPQPSWVKNLHWPTTDPFRLKWIVKEETPYRAVGNLKNPLNENLAVFVGRDGQEIPEKMGYQLCDIIDEDTSYRAKFRR